METGSPVADRDGDGLIDVRDACPDEPEDHDGFADDDGCVDRDNDADGIVDALRFEDGRWINCDLKVVDRVSYDWHAQDPARGGGGALRVEAGEVIDCRDMPEDRNGIEDEDGCPDQRSPTIVCGSPPLLATIRYALVGRLAREELAPLELVAADLRSAPAARVRIEAHVEPQRDREVARRSSQEMAQLVLDELARQGIARERLEAIGWGDSKPRSGDAADPAANRRIDVSVANESVLGEVRREHACR
ncbi:OmpA family protein [Nannocystis pusilla]|uniref:OmpA-like domain-containing protein n=1 Tax=Nannocystis pusilla TaxID=889268 RepID=A0ABS7U4W1_9BACT|nr:OmpA family protein [Nannocystis pusilla]MBZ5715589.1 hypothetical protein [Nannocystis pusilla]